MNKKSHKLPLGQAILNQTTVIIYFIRCCSGNKSLYSSTAWKIPITPVSFISLQVPQHRQRLRDALQIQMPRLTSTLNTSPRNTYRPTQKAKWFQVRCPWLTENIPHCPTIDWWWFTEYSLCARHCLKHFTCTVSCNPHKTLLWLSHSADV